MAERVCFLMHLRPERVDEYLEAHREVWPEMLEALSRHGWRDYSLFLRHEDGLVVGFVETDDFDAAVAGMDAEDVNARWQARMSRFFVAGSPPDRQMERLTQYFHLA
ncbi:L-rhamnose mutarotase [Geodermatophilus sp. SYSU D00703]